MFNKCMNAKKEMIHLATNTMMVFHKNKFAAYILSLYLNQCLKKIIKIKHNNNILKQEFQLKMVIRNISVLFSIMIC